MAQRIMSNTLCGLLAYLVLGLFLLGKGAFTTATSPLHWQFRIFAIVGFLIVTIGLLLLCLAGKRETNQSLRQWMSNPWCWGILGFIAVAGYTGMLTTTLTLQTPPLESNAFAGTVESWRFWINACSAILFGGCLSLFSVFIIVGRKKSTYSKVLLSVTIFVLVLCVATFVLTHLPRPIAPWANFVALIAFWIIGVILTRSASRKTNVNKADKAISTAIDNSSESEVDIITEETTDLIGQHTSNNDIVFTIRKNEHELPAMLISSLLGVFLFGVISNSDGNPGPFDWGSNALFGMLTMSLVLLPIVYILRKRNLVPIFYWLVFPLIASVLIVLDTLPEDNPLAYIGSTGVYFFCTVVFLFSLALLVMLVQNSENSPFLPIVLAEIAIALACLCGIAIANAFPEQDIRGPIVLIFATVYFIYVLLTPILLFWQSRKSPQQLDESNPAEAETTRHDATPAYSYNQRVNEIAESFGLSKREREILGLVGKGYNSPYIAATLVISENTTRTHLKNIYRKLSVGNRMEVVELVNGWEPVVDQTPKAPIAPTSNQ